MSDPISFAFLGLTFDTQQLSQELQPFLNKPEWLDHVNNNAHQGGWQVLPLRCQKANLDAHPILQAFSIECGDDYVNLPGLEQAQHFKQALAQLKCPIKSARLMKLDAGCHIKPHRDFDLCMEKGEARIHIPIQTSPKLKFIVNDHVIPMKAGEYWYINADQTHHVYNESDTSRINLVIDCVVNDWLKHKITQPQLAQTAYPASLKAHTEQLSTQVIEADSEQLTTHSSDILQWVEQLNLLTNIDEQKTSETQNDGTLTQAGKACSITTAMRCAKEARRTMVFWRAAYQAISEQLQRKPQVRILYAGTGPFGTILLPILHFFKPEQVKVHLLDLHQESIDCLHQVINDLQLSDFIESVACANALTWQSEHQFDVLISETMKAVLEQEPQVSIYAHLEPFLAKDGALVPQSIDLSATLTRHSDKQADIKLGRWLQFDRAGIHRFQQQGTAAMAASLSIPAESEQYQVLALHTDIQVYGQHWLKEGHSSLTIPKNYQLTLKANSQLNFNYVISKEPEYQLQYELVACPSLAPLIEFNDDSCHNTPGLARYWHKQFKMSKQLDINELASTEFSQDQAIFEQLGINMFDALAFIQSEQASLETFNQWLTQQLTDQPTETTSFTNGD